MNRYRRLNCVAVALLLLPALGSRSVAQQKPKPQPAVASETTGSQASPKHLSFIRAFVVDDRLSALRREPDLQSEVIHRLRLGRSVYIVGSTQKAAPRFCRVAVTRRTRGWILESALARSGKQGEDARIMKRLDNSKDGLDRIALCRLLLERFGHSQLIPRALLAMGDEADRA